MSPRKVDTKELAKFLLAQKERVVQHTVADILSLPPLRKKISSLLPPDERTAFATELYEQLLPAISAAPQKTARKSSVRLKKKQKDLLEALSLSDVQQAELFLLDRLQEVVRKEFARQPLKLGQYSHLISQNMHRLLLQTALIFEKARKKSKGRTENKYARLLSMASDAIVLVDFESGLFVEVNPAACDLTGYSEEELKQAGFNSIVSIFDLNLALEHANDAIEKGAVRFDNVSILTKKGNLVPVDISATAVTIDRRKHILAIIRDIKERKKFEQEIQQKAERLELLNQIAKAINSAELDTEAVLTSILKSISSVINVEAGSILKLEEGRLIFLAALGEKASLVKPFRLKLGQGIAGWAAEHGKGVIVRDAHKDPRFYREVEQATGFIARSILVVPMKVGKETIGVIELINKQKGTFTRADLELLDVISEIAAVSLRHAGLYSECKTSRMHLAQLRSPVSSSKLAAVVAHEMKDPLGIVKNYIRILEENLSHAGAHPEELNVVMEEVDRITNIVDQLLHFSEAYSEEPKDTPLNLLIENSIASARNKLESAGITANLRLETAVPELAVIPNQMNMVFSNLIKLAIAEMPAGGTLDVSSRRVNSSLCIEFRNSAARHTDAEAGELFLPSGVAKGLVPKGLGLYMVYNIVQGYGGDIKVSSGEGGGNVFSIYLPLEETAKGAGAAR